MPQEEKYIGYLKYSGKSVEKGFLDARKSAEALLGFDDILRYFLIKEDPSLRGIDFEIPVRVERGSWSVVVPEIIDKAFSPTGIATIAAGKYAITIAKKAAEDSLFNTGASRDVKLTFRAALKSVQWVVRISSHLGSMAVKEFKSSLISQETQEVEILNDNKKSLRVSKKYLDLYRECPSKLFSRNAGIIESDRILEFGVCDGEDIETVAISDKQKGIYYIEKEGDSDNSIILPELKHGQFVELEGAINRVTESTNTIGFGYEGHTLTCKPEEKRLASFKSKLISKQYDHVFLKVKLIGKVDRTSADGSFKEKRPQIIFSDIVSLEDVSRSQTLF